MTHALDALMAGPGHHRAWNLEYKTRLENFAAAESALQSLGARFSYFFEQEDTYFDLRDGRLKLRRQQGETELIAYSRDEAGPELRSRYVRVAVDDPAGVSEMLANTNGVRGVVRKTRRVWLWRRARIHMDWVEGLGGFLEVEVVDPPTLEEARYTLGALLDALELSPEHAIRASYIDLLEQARDAAEERDELARDREQRFR